MSISNCIALFSFGSADSTLVKALSGLETQETDLMMGGITEDPLFLREAKQLFNQTADIVLQRVGDPNILSFLHVLSVFLVYVSRFPSAMALLEDDFPWEALVTMLNTLIRFYHTHDRIEQEDRPVPAKNDFRPCPEEFAMRGLFWTLDYFPSGWFMNKNIEDENQYKEDASMNTEYRPEMILYLNVKLAKAGKWIGYNAEEKRFFLPARTPKQYSETDNESRSKSATIVDDNDDGMSWASESSRKSTWESNDTQQTEDPNWDMKTVKNEKASQDTRIEDHMDFQRGPISLSMETKDDAIGND